jgi:hypothetical protein
MPADTPAPEYHAAAQVSVRAGYCRYYSFGFITGGAEVAVRTVSNLHVLAGVEVYTTRQVNSPEVALDTGVYAEWNQVVPVNVGAMYEFSQGMVQPYAGADLIVASYYRSDKSYYAVGARARGGIDLMFIEHIGLNLNVALGAWGGSQWDTVETGTGSFGLLPQISAGTVIAF